MSPSTNTRSGPTTFNETTALVIYTYTSSYVTQTDLFKSLNVIFKTLESMDTLISNQDAEIEERIEK